ncbi:cysteine-rich venom protein 6 [Microplitis demolitor]|uniref:cysteine-rich venom protein 6 n=1 Tax=Microplitis demolitor TaxID=69319 RepID=UPI00235B65E5|nr:cysteine-rich venom protein 6 [Microplitis demolitor]
MTRYPLHICLIIFCAYLLCVQAENCGQNESFDECGRTCEPSCNYRRPACDVVCEGEGGCRCNRGTYRNSDTDSCVPASECPKN